MSTHISESDVDNIALVVPHVDRERLRLTLEAFNGNVDNAVMHLLSEEEQPPSVPINTASSTPPVENNPPPSNYVVYESGDSTQDRVREMQMREDENLARMLQAEEARQAEAPHRDTRPPGGEVSNNLEEIGETIQQGLNAAYTKAVTIGNAAATRIGEMYRNYMDESDTPNRQPQQRRPVRTSASETAPEEDETAFTSSDYRTGASLRRRASHGETQDGF
eukprot:CAMPEP_0198726954 /NCGR_PEP_ID=MMETSP1475-20131203/3840_1 /TAXON_ID= ORGANISM="Unidentified sp., Strain CCMP1999" /NCGR_SAMPLE_ID=MMETSP1475 /ASSEMBLY_ACC=CAM_ASM_001111 /LENGTH=220 /DNA_ID=CAMNT_0044488937 /DNA_START=74 /DNA_END=739 /DNA_ORIENTATION=+